MKEQTLCWVGLFTLFCNKAEKGTNVCAQEVKMGTVIKVQVFSTPIIAYYFICFFASNPMILIDAVMKDDGDRKSLFAI